ncbi:MAG: RHS repeat-associated core domain-containing protein [Proteobacteria bacterium]|nr:MAG: RHS repeat-associated core domain-containing protein [Pseudomonadota bacterium]
MQFSAGANTTFVDLGYDSKNRVTSVGNTTVSYVATDNLISHIKSGAVEEQRDYSEYGELKSMTSSGFSYSIERDLLGRVVTKSESIGGKVSTFNYGYDANDRLISVSRSGQIISQFTYDSNGNRVLVREAVEKKSIFDAQDRMLQQGDVRYEYNASGERTRKIEPAGTTTYTYGFASQLSQVQLPSGEVVKYDMNGKGQRLPRRVNGNVETYYLWQSALKLGSEITPNGSLRSSFVYGTDSHSPDIMVKDGITYRFVKDDLGSIRQVVNTGTGQIAQQLSYDAWGKVIENTNPGFQPFGFAGGIYDVDTKLVMFGARDYDAETGRWTSKDPILFNGGDSNLYAYAANDPLNFIDPRGTDITATIAIR